MTGMAKEMQQGLGLICVALVCLIISTALSGQGDNAARAVAMLFGIGGLALVAVGLFRHSSDDRV